MPSQRSHRPSVVAFAVLACLALPCAAMAQTTDSQGRTIDSTNAAAKRINQSNPRVVHAGPGVPAAGSIHVPPSQAKKDEKKD